MRGASWWWDDAVDFANTYAKATGRRHRVFRRVDGLWAVCEVQA